MVLFGGVIIRVVIDDAHVNYVKPSMGPWLLLSGVVLLVLGALAVLEVTREDDTADGDDDAECSADQIEGDPADVLASPAHVDGPGEGESHGHGHGHLGPRAAWALLLPVAAILLVPATPLGSFTANRIDAFAPAVATDALYPELAGDPADLSIGDFVARAVWDDGRTLAGQRVRLVGFVSPDGQQDWYLTRLGLACCAADAYALKVRPLGAPDFPADTWVQVTGTWEPGGGTQEPGAIPQIQVETIVPTAVPANPYDA
jgi:uncharacterized repeat protein (TIGR03943 family)